MAINTHTFHLLQVDVYVNTAGSSLDLRHGAVANSLRKSGGPKLQEECTQYTQAKGDVKVWEFATTRGHKLKCKHVIHTVGAEYDGQGGRAKKVRFSIIERSGAIFSVSVHSMNKCQCCLRHYIVNNRAVATGQVGQVST